MASITLKGNPIRTSGELPAVGSAAPDFKLVLPDLSEASLVTHAGKRILNIFPSVDTGVCATSVRTFNKQAGERATVINVSMDLPFAMARFCGAEGLENVVSGSCFRDPDGFMKAYGVRIEDGPLAGLCARAVVAIDADNKVLYTELVPEIGQEPNYAAALEAVA